MNLEQKKFKRVPAEIPIKELTPFDITCGSTKCEDGLHCFSLKKSSFRKFGKIGVCKECGIELIDWERIHKNNLKDSKFIFDSLKKELIRHVVWHTKIEKDALKFAKARGIKILEKDIRKILTQRIGKVTYMDGRQTPKSGKEIINYAQHATATCCRKCLEIWHNIPPEGELSKKQLEFCSELVMLFIKEKVPNLNEDGYKTKI